jgi:hypothetical protein
LKNFVFAVKICNLEYLQQIITGDVATAMLDKLDCTWMEIDNSWNCYSYKLCLHRKSSRYGVKLLEFLDIFKKRYQSFVSY